MVDPVDKIDGRPARKARVRCFNRRVNREASAVRIGIASVLTSPRVKRHSLSPWSLKNTRVTRLRDSLTFAQSREA